MFRVLETMIVYPAEETVYRVRPAKSPGSKARYTAEPIPLPWTWSKFDWSLSLFWSWRGIGWNYAAPLPPHLSRFQPLTSTITRKSFLLRQTLQFILEQLISDTIRSYMNLSHAATFWSRSPANPSVLYAGLSIWDRAINSTCIVLRIWLNVNKYYILGSIACVTIGGILGLEGELWSPWGWPRLFGGLWEIWRYPGLSHMWSKVSTALRLGT